MDQVGHSRPKVLNRSVRRDKPISPNWHFTRAMARNYFPSVNYVVYRTERKDPVIFLSKNCQVAGMCL